jgi:hypothetical protein
MKIEIQIELGSVGCVILSPITSLKNFLYIGVWSRPINPRFPFTIPIFNFGEE